MSQSGIIPALAGNTPHALLTLSESRDHPRACGEHVIQVASQHGHQGSSPRLRGTRRRDPSSRERLGIIPALAGNTIRSPRIQARGRDHPRACGEHFPDGSRDQTREGSSPRLRGTPRKGVENGTSRGIIPALAGNTAGRRQSSHRPQDHPRACGEHVECG